MLIWLDSTINKKAKPNENYAREVMELFTLGRGHYTEKDIQEAARAFTGWFVVRDEFQEVPRQHDDGVKTVLGTAGMGRRRYPGHPARAARLRRVHLPQAVPPLRERDADAVRCADRTSGAGVSRVGLPDRSARGDDPALEPLLRSEHAAPAGEEPGRVCGGDDPGARDPEPDGAGRGPGRSLSPDGPEPVCTAERRGLGWRSGLDQLDDDAGPGQSGLGLLSDQDEALGQRCNPWALAGRHGCGRRESLAGFFIDLLAAGALEPKARQQIEKAATNKSSADDAAAREVVRLILTAPEYQLA